jgi:sulfite exporter TauE/SafE
MARAGLLGALTALLPCGWLYAFVLTAAGTGSAGSGSLIMLAFWAGTVPALLAVGLGVRLFATPLMRRAPALTAWLLVAIGITTLSGRLNLPAFDGRVEAATSVADVRALSESPPPCCEDEE